MAVDSGADLSPTIGCRGGRRALLVDGTVQSVDPDDAGSGYWSVMLPAQPPRDALMLGFGGGTIAQLLLRRFGAVAITGVDDSPEVLRLGACAFRLAESTITLIQADAFDFTQGSREQF